MLFCLRSVESTQSSFSNIGQLVRPGEALQCRWGNAKSPAYGTLNDYQFMRRHTSSSKRAEKAKQCWGASLNKTDDVAKVFVKYSEGQCVLAASIIGCCIQCNLNPTERDYPEV